MAKGISLRVQANKTKAIPLICYNQTNQTKPIHNLCNIFSVGYVETVEKVVEN